jgi:hypothetical protein
MKTITAYKTRNGHYGFSDPASSHEFIILNDEMHAIADDGSIWQVIDELEDEDNIAYLTFEPSDDSCIFNCAEDGDAISWMRRHYEINNPDEEISLFFDIDWDKVEEEIDSEELFNKMKESKDEKEFQNYLIENFKMKTTMQKLFFKQLDETANIYCCEDCLKQTEPDCEDFS